MLAGIALGLSPLPGSRASDLVVVRDGTPHTVRLLTERGYPAASIAGLADALGYAGDASSLDLEGLMVRFTEGSPFFAFGGSVHQLVNPAYRGRAGLMIPISWVLDWLPRSQPQRWRYMDGRLVERSAIVRTPDRRELWLVVIDAGHGGPDPGAIGINGTKEKDLTLSIAKRLEKRLLRESTIEVVMTRSRDTLVSLSDRPRVPALKGRQPDLFISIHANSMPKKPSSMRGFETYFLAVAKTDQARQVALRENASVQFEGIGAVRPEDLDPLQFMLVDLQFTSNLRESSLFASSVNRSMDVTLEAPDLGVKQAGFRVLAGASIPAALVEIGYLSNTREERLLRSSSYQAKIADALADGIVNYLAGYARRLWSSSETGG